jgi:nucleoside-diphosphate-sugar epimerase
MNILITGGAGGIGSTLALLLTQNGHTVVAVDNFNNGYMENMYENGEQICDIVALDIRETKKLTELLHDNKTDVIVHLAALTSLPICESDPAECISVNVSGTSSVLTAARLCGIKRVIVASTSAIYENNTRNDAPFEEMLAVYPKLFYPLSKKLMEDTIQSYIDNYGMDIVTLRFFNVFGPRQDIHRKSPPLINYIAREVINNRKLTFFSDGYQVRDYIHVSDVVSLIEKCMVMPEAKNEIFNLCSGTLTSVHDIIEYAKLAFNKNLDYEFIPPKTFWSGYNNIYDGVYPLKDEVIEREVNKFSLGSCRKTSKILGWNPNKDIPSLMIDTFRNIKI